MSANASKRAQTQVRKRARKGAKERKGVLQRENCKLPGLKQPGLGTPKACIAAGIPLSVWTPFAITRPKLAALSAEIPCDPRFAGYDRYAHNALTVVFSDRAFQKKAPFWKSPPFLKTLLKSEKSARP